MDNSQSYSLLGRPAAIPPPIETSRSEHASVSISCFENEIPSFVEAELDLLYQNIFCSLPKLKVDGPLGGVSTYLVRKRDEIVTIFLFRREADSVKVLNEFMTSDQEEIERFAGYIFDTFKSVTVISFRLLRTTLHRLAFPVHRVNASEDIVVALPASAKEYLANLGKSTRQNINYYRNKLKRDYPSLSFKVCAREEIDDRQFLDIMELSRSRITGKGKDHGFGEHETELLLKLAKSSGMVGVLTIDGRVCAGTIYYRVGAHYYLYIIAHDSAYNDYGLGTFCCYLTICECINQGGEEFHFLWGREEYKYRLAGVQRDFDSLAIYRSRAHMLIYAGDILKTEFRDYARSAMLWLLAPARRKNFLVQLAINSVRTVRKLRQLRLGVQVRPK